MAKNTNATTENHTTSRTHFCIWSVGPKHCMNHALTVTTVTAIVSRYVTRQFAQYTPLSSVVVTTTEVNIAKEKTPTPPLRISLTDFH